MGDINLSLIIPLWIVVGLLLASVEFGARQARAAREEDPPRDDPAGGGTP